MIGLDLRTSVAKLAVIWIIVECYYYVLDIILDSIWTRNATIAMICSTLASLWKFHYFRRSLCKPVKHLWWSFYCENSKPLSIFIKSSIIDAPLGFKYAPAFWRPLKRYITLKYFTLQDLKSVISLNYFTFFNSSNMLLKI